MIRCLCIDDESLALEMMEDFIRKVPFLQLVAICNNPINAFTILETEQIDLLFIDIEMPEISGIQFIKSLKQRPYVIFSTAYTKYALEGFELDVIDYLLKPFSFDRFYKSVAKVRDVQLLTKQSTSTVLKQLPPDFLFVNSDYSLIKITISDISFIEGLKDYIKIFISGNPKSIVTRMSLKSIEDRLDLLGFKRIHKSYIVNLSKISSIKKSRLIIDGNELLIGDNYRLLLYKALGLDLSED
jgi:DNA-binding LytR/AlgR family response regulator